MRLQPLKATDYQPHDAKSFSAHPEQPRIIKHRRPTAEAGSRLQGGSLCALIVLAVCLTGHQVLAWSGVDIGSPATAGSFSENGGAVTLTGAGTGELRNGNDQLYFTYQPHPGGDVEIIVRLKAFAGLPRAGAGIMIRSSTAPDATTASIAYRHQDSTINSDVIAITARDHKRGVLSRAKTRKEIPLWLRLVRTGNNFAAYKSQDGVLWSMIANTSGGSFAHSKSIEIGLFVFGGTAASTATFDKITIREPQMGYSSTWFGNTFGGTPEQGHVTRHTRTMFTAPDGTCYANSPFDEGGEAAKIYRDGAVVKGIDLGNTFGYEGSITSDGKHIFLAGSRYLFKTDLQGERPISMPLSVDIWHGPFINTISGLAVVKDELFIGDSRHHKIRVATTAGPKMYYTASYSTTAHTAHEIDTSGVEHAAPANIYQTQRATAVLPYQITELEPGGSYDVRLHLAEWEFNEAGKRLLKVTVGDKIIDNIDIYARTGAQWKAMVLPIDNVKADGQGRISIMLQSAPQGNPAGSIVVSGIEVLSEGVQVRAINCGGPATEGYLSEVYDLPDRAFDFIRPGPMVADKRGHLWIIQQGNDFRQSTKMTTAYPAAVLCHQPDGVFTGKSITDAINPTALAYDAVNDQLLVADNSPQHMNIRIYDLSTDTPTYLRSFGYPGGIYAGKNPGLLSDPDAGGYQRFYGLSGVGIDTNGNIYVACDTQGTDLRKFTPDGKLEWMLHGLLFCNTPDVDPDSDGMHVYGPYFNGKLDFTKTTPGSEWSFTAFSWDPLRFGKAPRAADSQAIVRRVGPSRALIMYTSWQGIVGYVDIFRYDGEIAIPCGRIRMRDRTMEIWVDANGNGLEDTGETSIVDGKFVGDEIKHFAVDDRGDIWISLFGEHTPMLRQLKFLGLNEAGAPLYGAETTDHEDSPYPDPELGYISMASHSPAAYYDAVDDVMYLKGPAEDVVLGESPPSYLARYDQWSKGNRTSRWQIILPRPETSTDFSYEVDKPWGCIHSWMGMEVAGDKLFLTALWGPTHVFDVDSGTAVMIINPGPEIAGFTAWQDATMGTSTFERRDGETILFVENSGYDAKCNLYRIHASTTVNAPLSWPPEGLYIGAQSVGLTCSTSGTTIRYTLDGTEPTETAQLYGGPIRVTRDMTIKAKAFRAGREPSATTTHVYAIRYYSTVTNALNAFDTYSDVAAGVDRIEANAVGNMKVVADSGQLTISHDASFGVKALRNASDNMGVMVMKLPEPVALSQLGDRLTLSFSYRLPAAPAGRIGTPKFGLFNSSGTPASPENLLASTMDDTGYFAELSITDTTGYPISIGEENGTAHFALGGNDIAMLALLNGGPDTSVTDTNLYHVTFSLTVVAGKGGAAANNVQIDLNMMNSDGETLLSLSGLDDGVAGGPNQTVAPFTIFDEVVFRNSNQAVLYNRIKVTYSTPDRMTENDPATK